MMEDFSGLALPPLFGGHILEAELEPGGVELGPGEVELGPGGSELLESRGQEDEERRALDKRKYLSLSKRCKEIELVNQKILGRLHQVQRLTRRMKKERRFLMKTLDAHGDDYRNAQLTILLEDESGAQLDPAAAGVEEDRLNGVSGPTSSAALHHTAGPKKRRHRIPRQEKDKDQQNEPDMSMLADTQFGDLPSPTSLSH
ncbi:TCF3 fusion partner [Myripristis murdjan]|uniref:TCF3 (E2A) fusion partner n=1 Tax=Myripristis murdjan TaxID=586833 RepID=A0A667XT28_9TELE|nr:TCF3 fusion partner [Myripristis murdjan]XP_029929122.1 TCF3 fusion partner [Myripristis murdjan]